MASEETHSTCAALTRSGQPCKNLATPGSRFCRVHEQGGAGHRSRPAEGVTTTGAGNLRSGSSSQPPEGITTTSDYEDLRSDDLRSDGFSRSVSVAQTPQGANAHVTAGPPPVPESVEEFFDASVQRVLAAELDNLIARVQTMAAPIYTPPPFSPTRLVEIMRENLEKFSPDLAMTLLQRLRSTIAEDLLNIETWKGIWFVINYSLETQAGWLKRRLLGDYQTDEWGLDWEFLEAIRPFFEFMYRTYWRVETTGLERVPATGRALLVANHSGQLPWDGVMLGTAMLTQHPAQRLLRNLYASWFPTLPFFSALLVKLGQALATVENGTRLLEADELVGVYPEGYKGVGKLYRDRYRLARFGRGGFVKMALNTRAPIIPVSVVGAEETYISLARSESMAKLIGFPYFPISPTFPWLGLLGFVPLPTKWYIDIGDPIPMDEHGPGAAEDPLLVSQLSDQVRNTVQQMIYTRLAQRQSVFFG